MANAIKLKKGLDIPIEGAAEARVVEAPAAGRYALVPDDFHGIVPKVLVKPGDKVRARGGDGTFEAQVTEVVPDKGAPGIRADE